MRAKAILGCCMLILLSSLVYSIQESKQRSDYYYEGTYFLTDGLTTSDTALDGRIPTVGQGAGGFGWVASGANTLYSSDQAYLGSMSIKFPSGSTENIRRDIPDNNSFTGIVAYSLYVTNATKTLAHFIRYESSYYYGWWQEGGNLTARYTNSSGQTNFTCAPMPVNTWFNLTINYTATDVTFHVNNTLCGTHINGYRSLYDIYLSQEGTGDVYLDQFRVTNNQIPFRDSNIINISLYDEISNTLIADDVFTVIYRSPTTYVSNSSVTDNPFQLRNITAGTYDLELSSNGYPTRIYTDITISNVNETNLIAYLVDAEVGTEVTFEVLDSALNALDGATLIFKRYINDELITVHQGETAYNGELVVTLDPDYKYTVEATKEDYTPLSIQILPSSTSYTIQMESSSGGYNQSTQTELRYEIEPDNVVLNNNTAYVFNFTLWSWEHEINNCSLYLYNNTDILQFTSSVVNTSYCHLSVSQNTGTMDNITYRAHYNLLGEYANDLYRDYSILHTDVGQFSLKNFFDDLRDFGQAGFDDFGRGLVAFIVIFVIVALASMNSGYRDPEVLIPLFLACAWVASYAGWLYMDLQGIPDIAGLRQYIIAFLLTLAGGAFLAKKHLN